MILRYDLALESKEGYNGKSEHAECSLYILIRSLLRQTRVEQSTDIV
jgi:hypothetical protein